METFLFDLGLVAILLTKNSRGLKGVIEKGTQKEEERVRASQMRAEKQLEKGKMMNLVLVRMFKANTDALKVHLTGNSIMQNMGFCSPQGRNPRNHRIFNLR